MTEHLGNNSTPFPADLSGLSFREYIEHVQREVGNLEDTLGIHRGFFDQLQTQDDWSFIIKAHAMVESCVNSLLAAHVANPDLDSFFVPLPMNGASGKMALCRKWKLLESHDIKFILFLGTIRNRMAHNVLNVDKSVCDILAKLPPNEVEAAFQAMAEFIEIDYCRSNPKSGIYLVLVQLLAVISLTRQVRITTHKAEKLEEIDAALKARMATNISDQVRASLMSVSNSADVLSFENKVDEA